jgi:hypothetical protein
VLATSKAPKETNTVQKTIISKPAIQQQQPQQQHQQQIQQNNQIEASNKQTTVVIRNPTTKQTIGTKILPTKQQVVQKVKFQIQSPFF